MITNLLHTPEGVRDIYNEECEKKLYLQDTIYKTIKSCGFCDIQTPTFEFFDIYSKEKGSVDPKNMYKFFDREGNTLVLRPDMTPAIARAVSKYYMDYDMPLRFCYTGNTYINNAEHQGKLKEITQIGGELIGDNTSDCDAEAIAIIARALLQCGLTEFQIEIGHIDFLKGMALEAELDDESFVNLKNLLEKKNYFGVEELIAKKCEKPNVIEFFSNLTDYNGSIDILKKVKSVARNEFIDNALDRMEKIYNILSYYGLEKYVSFDLSFTSNYNYYTGVIFRAYTYATGEAIVTGGRYDMLLSQYGKDTPAIGFAINIDLLLVAMNRQKLDFFPHKDKILCLYENDIKKEALKTASQMREDGLNVLLIRKSSRKTLDDYKKYASDNNFDKICYINNDGNVSNI